MLTLPDHLGLLSVCFTLVLELLLLFLYHNRPLCDYLRLGLLVTVHEAPTTELFSTMVDRGFPIDVIVVRLSYRKC